MKRLLVKGGVILDPVAPRGRPADVIIEGTRIAAILSDDTSRPEDAEVLDASGCAIIPGLVNGHTHAHNNLLKGLGDRWTLEMSLTQAPYLTQQRSNDLIHLSTTIGAAEMLLKGCTACYDMVFEFPAPTREGLDAVARAYHDIGMRAVIAPMVGDAPFINTVPGLRNALADKGFSLPSGGMPAKDILNRLELQLRHWSWNSDRIRMALGPTIPMLCSHEFLTGCRDLSRDYSCGLHTHLCESKIQAVTGQQRYGCSIPEYLDRLGLLGPNLTCAHAVWLTPMDRQRLGDSGAIVVHNPGSNFRLGSGVADSQAMMMDGIVLGLGTDGATCADSLNMFEAMRLMTHSSRIFGAHPESWITAQDALWAATRGSAAALGFGDRIGRIEQGAEADLVVLDLSRPHYVPLNDLCAQVVYGEDSSGVRDVLVGGRQVVRNRVLTSIDYPALVGRANAAALDLAERGAEDRDMARRMADVAATFCHGMTRQDIGIGAYLGGACSGPEPSRHSHS
jgi:5-methylthioadenosine/S-adenosylhomocysteine deaminase